MIAAEQCTDYVAREWRLEGHGLFISAMREVRGNGMTQQSVTVGFLDNAARRRLSVDGARLLAEALVEAVDWVEMEKPELLREQA